MAVAGSTRTKALVECLDLVSFEMLSRCTLPAFDGRLEWIVRFVKGSDLLGKATAVFVVAMDASPAAVDRRIGRHRNAGHMAIGAYATDSADGREFGDGMAGLETAKWSQEVLMLLTSVVSFLGEGMPEVIICVDWSDAREAFDRPGKLIFEWSCGTNADAIRAVAERTRSRLSGRKCAAMIYLIGGGLNFRLKDVRAARAACGELLGGDAILLGGDRIAPFRGGTGFAVFAVAT